MEVETNDLVAMIGRKQIEIETLRGQLQVLAKGYQELQAKLQALEAPIAPPPDPATEVVAPKRRRKS